MTTTPPIDPIRFEIFKNALSSIVDEMALVIFRTAYSGVLKDVMDYSTAFCDRQGKQMSTVRFLFDGTRVRPEDTPDTVCI